MKTIFGCIAALLMGAMALPALAQSSTQLVALRTTDAARAWEGVGRLNLNGAGFCTGALISETLVLTAAHCLFDRESGQQIDAAGVEFLAGWRNGRASAYRRARRLVVHRDYEYANSDKMMRVATDIALVELAQPIRSTEIVPFDTHLRPGIGDAVNVVSYAKDRAEAPSLQEACHVLGQDPGVLVLSCDVNFGASGAPIFVDVAGQPRIASVVSAKAVWNDRKVALGAALGEPLEDLMAQMQQTDGVFTRISAATQVTPQPSGGAKFLRP